MAGSPEEPYGAVAPGATLRQHDKKRNAATIASVVSVLALLAVLALAVHSAWRSHGEVCSEGSTDYDAGLS